MAQARSATNSRNLPVIVNLISDDDDDDDDDGNSFSSNDVIMGGLPVRPAYSSRPQQSRQAGSRSTPRGSAVIVDSPPPVPQPAPRLLNQQPPRFEPVVRRDNNRIPAIRPDPVFVPRQFIDSDDSESSFEAESNIEDEVAIELPRLQMAPQRHSTHLDQVSQISSEDEFSDDDLDDDLIAQLLQGHDDLIEHRTPARNSHANGPARLSRLPQQVPLTPKQQISNPAVAESLDESLSTVATVFPGICLEYVAELSRTEAKSTDRLIAHILDKNEKGTAWPKAKDKQKTQKRKREPDEDERDALKYGAADRVVGGNEHRSLGVRALVRDILTQEFAETPMTFIDATLAQSSYRLFPAYRVLEEAERTFDSANPVYNKIRPRRKADYAAPKLEVYRNTIGVPADRLEIFDELIACRRVRKKAEDKRESERQAELVEEENSRQAERDGMMGECGCCYGDYPLNRMVHCNGEVEHLFCRHCSLKNAETLIGSSKYELKCMSMDGCEAGFPMDQRSQFLTETTVVALERNEQEAVLRMAGIENLASCPFCPYAAEYPPIEENKEFQCRRPECEKVSCRLCNLESHIPKSCEEFAKENGLSIRREIEEAMTAALIRRCNKCDTPFIKEEGCNKMTCSRAGCRNIQCYVCSKSCGYEHFDDRSRGGKTGNCPLFESVEQRHEQEVKEAEKAALAKVRAEHPEYTEDDLRVKMSENVQRDDDRRKANDPRALLMARMQNQAAHIHQQRLHVFPPQLAVPMADPYNNPLPPFIEHDRYHQIFINAQQQMRDRVAQLAAHPGVLNRQLNMQPADVIAVPQPPPMVAYIPENLERMRGRRDRVPGFGEAAHAANNVENMQQFPLPLQQPVAVPQPIPQQARLNISPRPKAVAEAHLQNQHALHARIRGAVEARRVQSVAHLNQRMKEKVKGEEDRPVAAPRAHHGNAQARTPAEVQRDAAAIIRRDLANSAHGGHQRKLPRAKQRPEILEID